MFGSLKAMNLKNIPFTAAYKKLTKFLPLEIWVYGIFLLSCHLNEGNIFR